VNTVLKLLDYLFFCRPILILAAWTVILLGASRHGSLQLTWLLAGYGCLLGAAFVINQLRDRESDLINNKLPHLAEGVVSESEARTLVWLLLIGGILFILRAGWEHFLSMTLLLAITTWAYNLPPLHLKKRFLAGPVTLGLTACLVFLQSTGFNLTAWEEMVAIFLSVTSICLLTELPDREGDRQTGRRTVAVVYGETATLRIAMLLMAVATVFTLVGEFYLLAFPALASTLLQLRLLVKRRRGTKAINLVIRVSLLLLGLAVAVAFLWFGLLILACYLVARKYYWYRFRRRYPSFTE
jgi:4-hydroxybenzoate polyprenyltransferase